MSSDQTEKRRWLHFLIVNEEAQKKSFYNPLPSSKVKITNTAEPMGQTKPRHAGMNSEEMYWRLLAIISYIEVLLD